MTLVRTKRTELNPEEWKEMMALKEAINYDPRTVTPEKMEEFTEYLVRSLKERGG